MVERRTRDSSDAGAIRRDMFMRVESEALLASGRRAKLFEHNTNRGNEAEEAIRRWLRGWLEPTFAISSGEIIDSQEPAGVPVARQQDGIVHANSLDGRRYTLPSGMRLVPVETLVATVEVKLTLSKQEFDAADQAAAELLGRQLAVHYRMKNAEGERTVDPWLGDLELKPLSEFLPDRVTFALFGYFGPKEVTTLMGWLRTAKALELVCCLESGCVMRSEETWYQKGKFCKVAEKDDALTMFVDSLQRGIEGYQSSSLEWEPAGSAYKLGKSRTIFDNPQHNEGDTGGTDGAEQAGG